MVARTMTMLATAVLVALSASVQAAAAAQDLFTHMPQARVTVRHGPEVLQAFPVRVDLELLNALQKGDRFILNLEPGVSFTARIERTERRANDCFTVAGTLEETDHGSFILVAEEGVVAGIITPLDANRIYRIRYSLERVQLVLRIDPERYPPGEPAQQPPHPDPLQEDSREPGWQQQEAVPTDRSCLPPPRVFDTMIVYTELARDDAGGTEAIHAECLLAIEAFNETFANSQIAARARLVWRGVTAYDEVGTMDDHLYRLTDPNDGVMDWVHATRNSYRADFVTLFTESGSGIGWCVPFNDARAFTVLAWWLAVGNNTYAHEIGHNLGCHHDRENADPPGCALESYSYGWRFNGDSGWQFRTTMAYSPGIRIRHFSNPNVLFDGQPTGVPIGQPDEAHNTQTIHDTSAPASRFRTTRMDVWVDFGWPFGQDGTYDHPFRTVAQGADWILIPVGGSEQPNLWIKAGTSSETVTISKPMVIRACGGLVVIGQ